MSDINSVIMEENFQLVLKDAVLQAIQESQQQNLQAGVNSYIPGYDELMKLVNSVITISKNTARDVENVGKNMGNMIKQFNPAVPLIMDVKEIGVMIENGGKYFNLVTIYETLESLSAATKLKASNSQPLTALCEELKTLLVNLERVLANYTPDFFDRMLKEADSGIDNLLTLAEKLEKFMNGDIGMQIPDTVDLAGVTMLLAELNRELANVDISDLDKKVQTEWKPVKIGLMCILDIIKDILALLGQILPLNISLGAGGGVAAGVNAHAKASTSVISLGKLGWGTASTLVSMLKTIISTGDAYVDLRIAQRKAIAA